MKTHNNARKLLATGFCGLLLVLTGCVEGQSFRDWVKQTAVLKEEALKQSQVQPYRSEQYKALQGYFKQLFEVTLEMSQNPKRVKQLNEALEDEDLGSVCSQILVPYSNWVEISGRCTKNRFFLCSEETRAYPEAVEVLRAKLSEKTRARFDQTETCIQARK